MQNDDILVTIDKQFTFDSAHQLPGHCGKCARLHGHTYKLTVCYGGTLSKAGSDKDMVLDYGDIKQVVSKAIIDRVDHRFISASLSEPIVQRLLQEDAASICELPIERTTAESMAIYFTQLLKTLSYGDFLKSVTLGETPSSSATVQAEHVPYVARISLPIIHG